MKLFCRALMGACLALAFIKAQPAIAVNVAVTNYRGAWVSTTNYGAGVVVTYQGSGYISLLANNKNKKPDVNPAWWGRFSAAGAQGPVGPAGGASVLDSTGAVVGSWLGRAAVNMDGVIMKFSGVTFWTTLSSGGFTAQSIGYTSPDCTGDQYEIGEATVNSTSAFGVIIGTQAFIIPAGSQTNVTLYSVGSAGGACQNSPDGQGGYNPVSEGAGPVSQVISIPAFVPPFRVEMP